MYKKLSIIFIIIFIAILMAVRFGYSFREQILPTSFMPAETFLEQGVMQEEVKL